MGRVVLRFRFAQYASDPRVAPASFTRSREPLATLSTTLGSKKKKTSIHFFLAFFCWFAFFLCCSSFVKLFSRSIIMQYPSLLGRRNSAWPLVTEKSIQNSTIFFVPHYLITFHCVSLCGSNITANRFSENFRCLFFARPKKSETCFSALLHSILAKLLDTLK